MVDAGFLRRARPTGGRLSVAGKVRRRRRKNLFVDQDKIDRVKTLLGTSTETEAIDRALDLVEDWATFKHEVGEGLKGLVGRGGVTDRFRRRRRVR
jgi:hypothetical protein